ncbi:MAG: amidohydrolase family protein [Acidobacteriota bacterium]
MSPKPPSPRPSSSDPSPPTSPRTVLVSERVVLGGLGKPLRCVPAAVEIEGSVLGRCHDLSGLDAAGRRRRIADLSGDGAEVVDLGGRALTPAFVNAHTHLVLGFLRAFPVHSSLEGNVVEDLFFRIETRIGPEDVRAFTRMGAYECLLHGVGMVWDHYYEGEALAAGLADVGLGGVVAPTLQDIGGPGKDRHDPQLAATEAIAGDVDLQSRGIFAALGPHATDTVSADLWRRAAEVGRRLDLPLHAHAAQSLEEYERAVERHGVSPFRWLADLGVLSEAPRSLLVHCLYASRDDLRAMDPERVALGFCPYAQRIFGFPADPWEWADAGLPFVLGTDVSAGNDSSNVQKEMRAVAELRTAPVASSTPYGRFLDSGDLDSARDVWRDRERRFGVRGAFGDPAALLTRVWSVPGGLHPGFRAGALEPGALANVAVWDVDHPSFWPCFDGRSLLTTLALGDTTQALHALWVAGRPVGTAGDFHRSLVTSDAYRDARREAEGRLRVLLDAV